MIKNIEKIPRNISAKIDEKELALCKAYIQGAVHGFSNDGNKEHFSVLSLFGKENTLWEGTPLYAIYKYYESNPANNELPSKSAGKDVGRLLKIVLDEDKFEYYEIDAFNNEYYRI